MRITFVPVALPGREIRFNDPLPTSIDALADDLADQLAPYASGRYAFFGYSMGALLSYEIGRRWSRRNLRSPEFLFVLGCNAPDRMVLDRDPFHTMNDADFSQALRDLGGVPPEIMDNSEAMAVFEPLLRNDFRICETYEHSFDRGELRCAAHVFVADEDEFIQWDAAAAWSGFVSDPVTMHALPGRHMIDHMTLSALPEIIENLWLGRDPSDTF